MNHADVSFLPIDCGFDPRAHDMPVVLPAAARSVSYDRNGQSIVTEGKTAELVRALEEAGYEVTVEGEELEPNAPSLLTLARRCKRAYPNAARRWSEIASDILAGYLDDEARNASWEVAQAYVSCVYGPDGDQPGDCYTRIGESPAGVWFVDDGDQAVRDNIQSYWSRDEALQAAQDLADSQHQGNPGEDADDVLHRQRTETAGNPDPHGEWCVFWETTSAEEHVVEPYATRQQAQARAEQLEAQLNAIHPGGQLLCGYGVRQLVDGEWVRVDE